MAALYFLRRIGYEKKTGLDRLSYRLQADFSMNYEACISGCKSNAVYGK